jgi:hypothetical protein
LFSAKTIAIKNNRLFAGNIVKEEFTIGDWDSRAVRFDVTNEAHVQDNVEGEVVITEPALDTPAEWDTAGWSNYIESHDGINTYNDPANDGVGAEAYYFQSDGATYGAEGPNIKIGFDLDTLVIDANSSAQTYAVGTEVTADNQSYTNFGSPYLSGRRSWQRDEVYRLYIVFFDAHGRSSNAKWICDLRMPSGHDATYGKVFDKPATDVEAYALYPTITLKSFPTGAQSAQLLRVERGGSDRSVLTQALAIPYENAGSPLHPLAVRGTSFIATSTFVKLVSPELNITKQITLGAADYIDSVSTFTNDSYTAGNANIMRSLVSTPMAYSDDDKAEVIDAMYVTPRDETDSFTFAASSMLNYNPGDHTYGCSGLLVHIHNVNWIPTATTLTNVIVNYKRDVHASQYGGQTYENREGNVAIPASGLITDTSETTAWNGDTFINYFDVTYELTDLTHATGASKSESAYV